MKRIVIGILWFMLFGYGLTLVGALAAEWSLPAGADELAWQTAREDFVKSYGRYIFFGSLLAAAAGTLSGFLPGTRKPRD